MAQANVKLTVDATSATRALSNVQNKTNSLQKSFGGLKTAIAGIGLTVLARNAVKTAANFNKLNIRLKLLTKESGTFARSQKIAAEAQTIYNQLYGQGTSIPVEEIVENMIQINVLINYYRIQNKLRF